MVTVFGEQYEKINSKEKISLEKNYRTGNHSYDRLFANFINFIAVVVCFYYINYYGGGLSARRCQNHPQRIFVRGI